MSDITVFQMPLFKRSYKKLKRNQQEATDQAIARIIEIPTLGEQKKGDLNGVYVYQWFGQFCNQLKSKFLYSLKDLKS